jgi:Predicted RNA methylase
MKLRKLEMALEKIEGFETPNIRYEQYKTPAVVAAPFLHMAFMNGEIEGKTVYDLGCGTGMLSIGAALLGAKEVIGFDIDKNAIADAEKNAQRMTEEIEEKEMNESVRFILSDVADISKMIDSKELKCADTVIMNPPFGAQEKGNDRPFLDAAIAAGNVVYSIHNKGSRAFIEKYIKPAVVTECFITDFPIRKTYGFHKKDIQSIDVEIYRIDPCRKK